MTAVDGIDMGGFADRPHHAGSIDTVAEIGTNNSNSWTELEQQNRPTKQSMRKKWNTVISDPAERHESDFG